MEAGGGLCFRAPGPRGKQIFPKSRIVFREKTLRFVNLSPMQQRRADNSGWCQRPQRPHLRAGLHLDLVVDEEPRAPEGKATLAVAELSPRRSSPPVTILKNNLVIYEWPSPRITVPLLIAVAMSWRAGADKRGRLCPTEKRRHRPCLRRPCLRPRHRVYGHRPNAWPAVPPARMHFD